MVTELPEQLLEQARLLVTLVPNQANLRRAVASAYYSLFHLLIREAALKWSEPLHRARIARIFEHERMKKVSAAIIKTAEQTVGLETNSDMYALLRVADAFVRLQQARHDADYNLERPLDPGDANAKVELAVSAFA